MSLDHLFHRISKASRSEVLTHRSWSSPDLPCFERLELLGDAVLQLIVTEALMAAHPYSDEGELAWMRQTVVDRRACADAAERSGLIAAFTAGTPADVPGRAAILASTRVHSALAEALIGAAWRDLPADEVRDGVTSAFADVLARARPGVRDPKTALQEAAARQQLEVRYELTSTAGPAHARHFETRVLVGERALGFGAGTSKRASETAAASEALQHFAAVG